MRKDMDKLIVERPRYKSWDKSGKKKTNPKNKSYEELDEMPRHEGIKKQRRGGTKELNEFLAPLERFLRKQVGRPWNKVYSEIRANINMNSAVQFHIMQHVWDFVLKDTFWDEKNKQVMVARQYAWNRDAIVPIEEHVNVYWRKDQMYIHPKDGLLKTVSRKQVQKYEKRKNRGKKKSKKYNGPRVLDFEMGPKVPKSQMHMIDGIWYLVTLKKIPSGPYERVSKVEWTEEDGRKFVYSCRIPTDAGAIKDVKTGRTLRSLSPEARWKPSFYELRREYGYDGVYGASIKQANSKELKRAGVKNDPPEE